MLSADYQEFANRGPGRRPWQYRDFRAWHGRSGRNRRHVAGLPRKTGTKAELSACLWAQPDNSAPFRTHRQRQHGPDDPRQRRGPPLRSR